MTETDGRCHISRDGLHVEILDKVIRCTQCKKAIDKKEEEE